MSDSNLWRKAIQDIIAMHAPKRIYAECGHDHTVEDDEEWAILDVDEIGLVCEAGYRYSVCGECCADSDGNQLEECADTHKHTPADTVYCRTVRAVAARIGMRGVYCGEPVVSVGGEG
jgi:hypothetical protein